MKRSTLFFGLFIAVALGAGLVVLLKSGGPQEGYLEGEAVVKGETYTFKYKRYRKLVEITKDFRWQETLTKSPLDTVLTEFSRMRREAPVEEYVALYRDPDRARREVIGDIVRLKGVPEDKVLRWFNDRFEKIEVLGEVVYKDITLVVRRIVLEGEDFYEGACVVKSGDKYLMGIDLKGQYPLLRHLSAKQYGVITGVKGE